RDFGCAFRGGVATDPAGKGPAAAPPDGPAAETPIAPLYLGDAFDRGPLEPGRGPQSRPPAGSAAANSLSEDEPLLGASAHAVVLPQTADHSWYVNMPNGNQIGPVSSQALREGLER